MTDIPNLLLVLKMGLHVYRGNNRNKTVLRKHVCIHMFRQYSPLDVDVLWIKDTDTQTIPFLKFWAIGIKRGRGLTQL